MRIIQVAESLLFERGDPAREKDGGIDIEVCVPADAITIGDIRYAVTEGHARVPLSGVRDGYNVVTVSNFDRDIPCEMICRDRSGIRPAGIDLRRALISLAYKIDVTYASIQDAQERIAKLQAEAARETDLLSI